MIRRPGLAILALCAASPASAAVATVSETGFVVRLLAETTAAPDEAWRGLVAPADWWDSAHTYSGDAANLAIDARASGCFCEVLPPARGAAPGTLSGSVEHMRVVYAEPGRFLRMSGGLGPLQSEAVQGTLTMTLKPQDGGTRILWEYVVGGHMRYKSEQIAAAVDQVLARQIDRLAARLGLPETAATSDDAETEPADPLEEAPLPSRPAEPAGEGEGR